MLPLLPFALGLLAGGLAVRTLRDGRLRDGLRHAQDSVRSATVSSLTAVENSAHAIKQRLEPATAAAPEANGVNTVTAAPGEAAPAPKPRKKRGAAADSAPPAPRRASRHAKAAPAADPAA